MNKIPLIIKDKLLIGRDEWCSLPTLNIPAIKAKIDTGAQTSALHAFNIHPFNEQGQLFVQFDIHPLQRTHHPSLTQKAKVVDQRYVTSSNGHKEKRYVIESKMVLGGKEWDIELTLSNRDPLRFRMLLGRQALNGHVYIDPHLSCHQGKIGHQTISQLYTL